MPNALFHGTGQISMTGALKDPDNRTTLNFQPLPWFEGSFRYSVVEGYFPGRAHQPDLFDRSFDVKVRLAEQGAYWPALAIGAQDIAGTGIFSAEYVVATWQTENFNFTAGVGFGRFASRGNLTNPLTFMFDGAKTRDGFSGDILDTGKVRFGQYFQGEDMGVFGGIEYLTPVDGLKLIVEYSSDSYTREEKIGIADPRSPINVGVSWRYNDNIEIGGAYVNGETFAIRLTLQTNPLVQVAPNRLDPIRFQYEIRDDKRSAARQDNRQPGSFYNQYVSATQTVSKPEKKIRPNERDYLSAKNIWNPWEPVDRRYAASLGDLQMTSHPTWERLTGTTTDEPPASSSARTSDRALSGEARFEPRLGGDPVLQFASWQASASPEPGQTEGVRPAGPSFAPQKQSQPDINTDPAANGESPNTHSQDHAITLIRRAARMQKIGIYSIEFTDTNLHVYYFNGKYNREAEAVGRLLPILSQAAPDNVETFSLTVVSHEMQVTTITVPRGALERIVQNSGSPQEIFNTSTFESGGRDRPSAHGTALLGKRSFVYGLRPSFRYSLFDPDDPMRYGFSAVLSGTVRLFDGFSISGGYRYNLYDNFDEIRRQASSVLPHVRTDFTRYLNESDHGVDFLQMSYAWKPAKNWFVRDYVGYFEEMYAGVGTEVLYRPFGKRWAAAIEVDFVQQRNFDRGFGLQDYKTVTGFAKFYYQASYQDLKFEVNVGRYLAKDYGATFKVSRTFDNGIEVGAFATLTDVPFEDFGEGSFDKGLLIKIPFHTFSMFDTKRAYSTIIRPLSRDGGAQVWSGTPLYDVIAPYTMGSFHRNWGAILE